MTTYSVMFSPEDPEFPSEIVGTVESVENAVMCVYIDIYTKRRPFYCDESAYSIQEYNDEDYMVWTLRADEVMAQKSLEKPHVMIGDYVLTPSWLCGKAKNKKAACAIVKISIDREWICLVEVTSRGISQDIRKRHYVQLSAMKKLKVVRRWEIVSNRPAEWQHEAVR